MEHDQREGQVGSLAWARRSRGNLSRRERLALLTPILQTTVAYAAGRLRLTLGLRPARQARLNLDALRWPDSALARAAAETCRAELSPALANHSYRTFVFALALAALDGTRADPELLYVSALLHDIALERPAPGHCFAARGAEQALAIARQAGCAPPVGEQVAEAIAMHLTPGAPATPSPLGSLVAAGALVDLLGLRLESCDPALVAQALERYPRAGLKRQIRACWRQECLAVPRGRAALIERAAAFRLFIQLAPFPE